MKMNKKQNSILFLTQAICMNKIMLSCLLLFSIAVSGQTDTAGVKFSETPDSTGFGTPDGKLISKEIGASGGKIVSDDGRIEFIFPGGALTNNTVISIQPTTNPAPNGTGRAYRCEPSGIQFKKPVQIIFHYTKEETESCPADWMNIASQDHNGKWSFSKYENWDSSAMTLKGFIHHFSSYANSNGAMLKPEKNRTIVQGKVNINFYDRYGTVQSGPFLGNTERQDVGSRYWTVNAVREGNELVGYVSPAGVGTSLGAYTAPKIMPVQNPVVVHLFFEYYSEILGKEILGVVSCKILVYDEYKVEILLEHIGRASMGSLISDKGSFVVRVSPAFPFVINGIQNYEPNVIKEGKRGPFKEKVYTEGFPGMIHLVSEHSYDSLSADYPPEVYFEFKPRELPICGIRYKSRGVISDLEKVYATSIPVEINFIANGQEQRYNISLGGGEKYKLIVTPYRTK